MGLLHRALRETMIMQTVPATILRAHLGLAVLLPGSRRKAWELVLPAAMPGVLMTAGEIVIAVVTIACVPVVSRVTAAEADHSTVCAAFGHLSV
jgi:hypothetical protein